jgi:hypothetical protein
MKEYTGPFESKKLSGTSEQTHPTYLSHRAHLRQRALLKSRASYALVTSQIPQCRRTFSILPPRSGSRFTRNSLCSRNPSPSERPKTPHGRLSLYLGDMASARYFYALVRECSAKPVRCSTPTIALDSLTSNPR